MGRKRIERLKRVMGIEAIYARPRTSEPHPDHRLYPYLLRDVVVSAAARWSADNNYEPMQHGYMYKVAIRIGTADTYWRGAVEYARQRLMCGGPPGRDTSRSAGDFQHRRGDAVHERGLHGRAGKAGERSRSTRDGRASCDSICCAARRPVAAGWPGTTGQWRPDNQNSPTALHLLHESHIVAHNCVSR